LSALSRRLGKPLGRSASKQNRWQFAGRASCDPKKNAVVNGHRRDRDRQLRCARPSFRSGCCGSLPARLSNVRQDGTRRGRSQPCGAVANPSQQGHVEVG
jgi:hypothetical protein